jgi:hypothetical protein
MKNTFKLSLILLLLFLGNSISFSQGTNCNTATPFCSNGLDPYPAGVNNPAAPLGNNYDCLFTQPNPAWFYLTISRNGAIDFTLDNTAGVDIDFILYGPFPSIAAAVTQCGNLGNGGASGAVAACSYSGFAVEPVNVANVQAGQVYILLITNFSNQPTDIFATPNSGSGDYACDCETSAHFTEAPAGFNIRNQDGLSARLAMCDDTLHGVVSLLNCTVKRNPFYTPQCSSFELHEGP